MSSKVASAIRGAACCGPRGRRAKRSGRCNARAPGSSYPGHRQRPRCWVPYVKPHPRTWHRKGNALLSIANVSACRAGPCDRPKRNLTNCVRDGRRYRLQAQGDFCGIAKIVMPTIQIELPDEVLLSLKETPESFTKVIRMAAAAKLYELGKLSSGRAADLAGLSRVRFLQALGQYGVPIFDLTEEELAQDLRNA